jgi:hypothetical protein
MACDFTQNIGRSADFMSRQDVVPSERNPDVKMGLARALCLSTEPLNVSWQAGGDETGVAW